MWPQPQTTLRSKPIRHLEVPLPESRSLKYFSITSRYLGGMSRVMSVMALARSFSGSLPHTSAISFNLRGSTLPGPEPVPPLESFCGELGLMVLFGELPGLPPLGQPPPFQDPP